MQAFPFTQKLEPVLLIPTIIIWVATGSCNDNQTVMVKMSSSYSIFMVRIKTIFFKICFNETPKEKINNFMIISMVMAFHPINYWLSMSTGNTIQRRYFYHNNNK